MGFKIICIHKQPFAGELEGLCLQSSSEQPEKMVHSGCFTKRMSIILVLNPDQTMNLTAVP